jgi:para-nitrobenzyl esterase
MADPAAVEAATSHGRLQGLRQEDVCIFRGVPFARAPVGPLRFRPPQALQGWCGVRDVRAYGPSAPQNKGDPLASIFEDCSQGQSEDCLTLNLWTPATDGARRPVLVWIHGGRFVRGSASEIPIDGAALARRGDIVVVAIQYRLGPLGFLHVNGGRPWDSNVGLRDQIAALEWVRSEIAAFGGDPDNVTLSGQSAGAISAGALLCSPRARGLFHRAILQSGPPVGLDPAVASPVADTLLQSLALTDPEHLRHLPVEALLASEEACNASPGSRPLGLPYMPVVDGDVLPADPFQAARERASAAACRC